MMPDEPVQSSGEDAAVRREREEGTTPDLDFGKLGGLMTAVAQDARSGEVLMVAFMSPASLAATRETGFAHYYSRSRDCIWKKGESSGNLQSVEEILVDCDQDALLLRVRQHGVACHTERFSCFYRRLETDEESGREQLVFRAAPQHDPKQGSHKPGA